MRERLFFSTCWSMVLKAGDSTATTVHALSALSELCQVYWRPVYGFLRKQGYSYTDAQDLTQGFFAHLIEHRTYAHADREKGRFRSFLLAVLKRFMADARNRQNALKRGGGIVLEDLDVNAQAQAATWPVDEVYDREWAASLVRQALDRLAQECALVGKTDLLKLLMPRLVAKEDDLAITYEEMARWSHRSVATLRQERTRLGARFRVILREEVHATVPDPTEVDDELRYLCRVLAAT